jgi:carbonic anhydrase/acetyltransferase-like protein (isoleucine patch superfamily)
MLIRHRDREPKVDHSAFVAPTAALVGDVRVGPRSRVMYGAALDSEASRVEIGECTIVCENAVLRATKTDTVDQPVDSEITSWLDLTRHCWAATSTGPPISRPEPRCCMGLESVQER